MHHRRDGGKVSWGMLALIVLLLGLGIYAWLEWGKLRPERVVVVEGFPDISDLAWLEERQSFIAVSDEGLIGEVDLAGNVLQLKQMPGYDLESVSTVPGQRDQVLVMDECGARLLWFSVPDLEVIREQKLPEAALVADSCNKQIEGMALQGDEGMVLANEGPAMLLFFDRALQRLSHTVEVDTQYISEVIELFDGSLLVVSRDAGLRLYSATGKTLGPWRKVSHGFIEGGTFVPGEGLVLCVDRDPSKLLFFPQLQDNDSIMEHLLYPDAGG